MKRRKLRLSYRISKWFYEDSVKFAHDTASVIFGLITALAFFGSVLILPAFFH